MKKLYFITFLLLIFNITSAQQDEKSKNILEQVREKTNSFKTIQADFSYSMQNEEMDINENNDGTIILKGQKYYIDLPGLGVKIYSDGKTIWNYMKDGNQVTISNIDDESNDLMDPASLFNIYEKGFESKFISESKEGDETFYKIELNPENKDQDIIKVDISINKSSLLIHSVNLFSTDGNKYAILIKKMETNKTIPDSDFVFDPSKYKDIEIIDLR